MSRALALLGILVALQGADGKGATTRSYVTPTRSSNVWKYGAAGGIGGAASYYVGSRLYSHRTYYGTSYSSYYNSKSQSWRNKHKYRTNSGTCAAQGLREDETDAWVIAEVVLQNSPTFDPVEFEVDMFNELSFRASCATPTQIITMYKCNLDINMALTDTLRNDPSVCQFQGDVTSLPFANRRRLLQAKAYTVVEFAIGADDTKDADILVEALKESIDDDTGKTKAYYNMMSTAKTEIVDADTGIAMHPALTFALAASFLFCVL